MQITRSLLSSSVLIACILLSANCSVSNLNSNPTNSITITTEIVNGEYDSFLQYMITEEHFSGAALVIVDGDVLHAKGYGLATDNSPNTVKTKFHVASVSKQFTAAAILQLVERGELSLDASINQHLPPNYQSPNWNAVTVHHLLSHTSGIPDYGLQRDYYKVVDGFTLGDTEDGMIKEAMGKPLEFSPGTEFRYSNIGYTLLGQMITAATSVPYEDYIRLNILEPMGMLDSRVHVEGHIPDIDEASGYRWNEELAVHRKDEVVTLPVTAPDGGLITTLEDFARWTRVYFDGNEDVVSSTVIDAMLRPYIDTGDPGLRGQTAGYGYGLFLSEDLISHPGYIVGFRSHFIVDRDDSMLVAIFTNNTTNNPARIAAGLLRLVSASN